MNQSNSCPNQGPGQGVNTPLRTTDGRPFEVPVDGSLGILALGFTGLMLWRQKRKQSTAHSQIPS